MKFTLGDFVDLSDPLRKRAVQEAEYQQQADAGSRVLRVSGKVPAPVKKIVAPTERIAREIDTPESGQLSELPKRRV